MKSIWGRQNKPLLKVEINDIGQPCGKSATRFANFIGTQVRTKGFPVGFDDCRKIDVQKKIGIWNMAKLFWDIEQDVFNWYMKTAQTKWKEFKVWSARGKANRLKHTQIHTSGSKSFARIDSEMTEELGCHPHRDQLFIRTHTHKSGVPHKDAAKTIANLQKEAINHPELTQRSMQEGDLFAFVCGKEKNGYVRTIGLGPTPADLELPGTRKYKSTMLQMEIEARRVANQKVEHMQQKMDEMQQQMDEMKQLILEQQAANTTPQQGSNTPQRNARVPEVVSERVCTNRMEDAEDEAESNSVMHRTNEPPTRRRNPPITQKQDNQPKGGGKDVILYSIARPFNTPVAKGIVQTNDRKAAVGGEPLGAQYVEVLIHSVFKRDTPLPRPYGDVKTMGDARGKSIAWPNAMVKNDMPRGALVYKTNVNSSFS